MDTANTHRACRESMGCLTIPGGRMTDQRHITSRHDLYMTFHTMQGQCLEAEGIDTFSNI